MFMNVVDLFYINIHFTYAMWWYLRVAAGRPWMQMHVPSVIMYLNEFVQEDKIRLCMLKQEILLLLA